MKVNNISAVKAPAPTESCIKQHEHSTTTKNQTSDSMLSKSSSLALKNYILATLALATAAGLNSSCIPHDEELPYETEISPAFDKDYKTDDCDTEKTYVMDNGGYTFDEEAPDTASETDDN